jgi:translation initiation factor IF-3
MDYGKYKYEAAQKAKESRRKASNVSIKEMKYRPKISKGDFDTKTRKVERFLQDGHKVKVTLTFRGREMHHPELGRRILDQVVEAVDHLGKVEIFPRQDGRNMTMVLGPDRKAQAATERARRQGQPGQPGQPEQPEQPEQPRGGPAHRTEAADGDAEAPAAAPEGATSNNNSSGSGAPAPAPARAAAAETSGPVSQNQPGEG